MLGDNFFVHSIPNLKINTGSGLPHWRLWPPVSQKCSAVQVATVFCPTCWTFHCFKRLHFSLGQDHPTSGNCSWCIHVLACVTSLVRGCDNNSDYCLTVEWSTHFADRRNCPSAWTLISTPCISKRWDSEHHCAIANYDSAIGYLVQ